MDNFDNRNSGAIFPNENKFNENSPSAKGSCEVECPHCGAQHKFWLAAWKKVSKKGQKFMSLAFTADDPSVNKPAPAPAPADYDEDIPF